MKNKHTPFISKSKYIAGLQCLKLLWYQYNRKEEIPEMDAATRAIMDQGNVVGELARTLYPTGIKLDRDVMPEKLAERSLEAARLRKPLFEAGLIYKRAYALPDILVPVGTDAWDLIEVKSTSEVKDEHMPDVAFQKYTYEGAGLKIRRCYLMYINNQYVRDGEIEPEKLFKKEDITEEVNRIVPGIEKEIDRMLDAIAAKDVPHVKVGRHCAKPHECDLQDICWAFLPAKDHVFCLYNGRKTPYELMDKGILSLADIPEGVKLTDIQHIQVDSHGSGKPYVDKEKIRKFISGLKYPLYFLDFETMGPAIPLYDHSRPYEQIPFQYSLHIVRKEGGRPESYSYLAPDKNDPRPAILKQLKELLGNSGSVIAYNAGFEKGKLQSASECYPEYKTWMSKIDKRFVDLLAPFRSFHYYHPGQAGSASIKSVLPVLTSSSYKNMEIADGGSASREYHRVTFGNNIADSDRARVRAALEKYCALDTMAMIDVLDALRKEVS